MATPTPPTAGSSLKRALTLRDLILYGVIVIQPVAPMSSFGVLDEKSRGHAVTAILIAMVAMLLTAISYGKMAAAYPSAGSAFTYVGKEIHAGAGYATGWSMVMDYMLNPMICILWSSKGVMDLVEGVPLLKGVPFAVWAILFFALFTTLNLRGIEASARTNTVLAGAMGVVIVLFFAAAFRYIFGHSSEVQSLTLPFYNPTTWSGGAILAGTSIAVLTYIGFDGISTLSEEAENPRRNILMATVLACLVIGILSAIQVYFAQLIWSTSNQPYPQVETAFAHAAKRAWPPLFTIIICTLIVANSGSGTGAQLGAARLLYGMGRSGALPPRFFAYIDPQRRIPRNNVLLVGLVALLGALVLEAAANAGYTGGYDLGVQLLNFGALIAFMGVNLAAFVRYFIREGKRTVGNLIPPLAGFAICLLLWLNLSRAAKIWGAGWLLIGLIFGVWKTRGFRSSLVNFDFPVEDPNAGTVAAPAAAVKAPPSA